MNGLSVVLIICVVFTQAAFYGKKYKHTFEEIWPEGIIDDDITTTTKPSTTTTTTSTTPTTPTSTSTDQHTATTENDDLPPIIPRTEDPLRSCKLYEKLHNMKIQPSFRRPGRVSEKVCEAYEMQVKLAEDKDNRWKECLEAKYKNKELPPAAVGGRPTYSGEFPHMGALGWKAADGSYIFKCGSTLISPKYVLTAAHCSRSPVDETIVNSAPEIVRLNGKNLIEHDHDREFTEDFKIKKIINHPEYKYSKKYYDISLMELEYSVNFDEYAFIRPACLWSDPDPNALGTDATLTGWGALSFGSREMSPELQAADVNIIPQEECAGYLTSRTKSFQGLVDHQLCAGKLSGGVDACQGDSGGPLQTIRYKGALSSNSYIAYRHVLYNIVGVTSFGNGCGFAYTPGVYTRVSSFVDWIEPIVWPEYVNKTKS